MRYYLLIFFLLITTTIFGQNDSIPVVNINENESNEVPFAVIDQVPVYPGCDHLDSNKDQKKCMSEKITAHVQQHFKLRRMKKLNLSNGKYRILVVFKIDAEGKVIDVKARGPHPTAETEALRVVNKLPKMVRPGMQRGKPVIVPYSLPMMFQVDLAPINKN